ncbi:ATP-binding protein [Spiractinospora alimapuensis]|uniref:ATP-binding protein n=1 Tax=Spiractinospora alimapuensis TaxID=2820884 RepID=UPI001F2FD804|nr:ATP-binding protein [Spiractinospora alimapuensis]QVQ53553.1 ATP-binding protein [Spiractinospora alimapuensis]
MTTTMHVSLPGSVESVGRARDWLREILPTMGLTTCVEDALLVISELATNAVRHSRSGDPLGRYQIRVHTEPPRVLLAVTDAGGPHVPATTDNATTDFSSDSGHGLRLVEHFAQRWWCRGDSRSRTVTAELAMGGA